jgi:hypothetical protein
MKKLFSLFLILLSLTLVAQKPTNDWKAKFNGAVLTQRPWIDSMSSVWRKMFPDSPPPLQNWSDSGYIIENVNPNTDILTLTKLKGRSYGGIYFYDLVLKFTFIYCTYNIREEEKIKLKKIYKLCTDQKNCIAVLTELNGKIPMPIAIIYYQKMP